MEQPVKTDALPRLLFIICRSDVGGETRHLYDLCLELKEKHPESYFAIAAPDEIPFAQKFKELTPDYFVLPKKTFSPWHFLKLWQFSRLHQIELIHSHGREAGVYSRLLRLFCYKVLHTFHGIHITLSFYGAYKYILGRLLAPLAYRYVCVSPDEKAKALRFKLASEKKIVMINNGINLAHIDERCTLRQPDGSFVLGTLTRFDTHKGLDLELQTFASFFKTYPNAKVRLKIAGSGDEWDEIFKLRQELKLEDKVELLGEIHNPIEFLSTLDCYVSFSKGEGLPLAVLEAMACSLPCLLSNVTGHRALVDKNCGLLFNLGDEHEFFSQLLAIKENRIMAQEMGKASRVKIEKHFTKEKMGRETFNLYKKF